MSESSKRLSGRRALVTGASAGIGRATAMALAREGATVIATGRRVKELESLAESCGDFAGDVRIVAGDIGDPPFVEALVQSAHDVDILVNNAGVLTYAPFLELTGPQIEDMFRINVLSSIRLCQRIAQGMAARKSGHIVMITSLSARNINRYSSVYGATKHAMAGITKGLRLELSACGLKITEVAPGMVDTEIRNSSVHPDVVRSIQARSYEPLTPSDVAQAVLYAVCTPPNCCPDLIELRPTHA